MLAEPFIDHLLNDESLTDGLADSEAKILLTWLLDQLESRLSSVEGEAAAWELTRSLSKRARCIAQVTQELAYNQNRAAAERLWAEAGNRQSLVCLEFAKPSEILSRLIVWEMERRA